MAPWNRGINSWQIAAATWAPPGNLLYGRDGKPASIYALRKGAAIRFTLDATDPMHRRVAVIYLN